eukprot:m.2813 g.2813  ORF g.2813 m.2813 type:complete len:203 (+) comp8919_c0_seq1:59-667(+)
MKCFTIFGLLFCLLPSISADFVKPLECYKCNEVGEMTGTCNEGVGPLTRKVTCQNDEECYAKRTYFDEVTKYERGCAKGCTNFASPTDSTNMRCCQSNLCNGKFNMVNSGNNECFSCAHASRDACLTSTTKCSSTEKFCRTVVVPGAFGVGAKITKACASTCVEQTINNNFCCQTFRCNNAGTFKLSLLPALFCVLAAFWLF